MRDRLARIYSTSASPLARDLAGTLKDLVPETFSGIYGNANKDTRWLSTSAYADLVSGSSFRTRDLADGRLTVFVQVPLKTLQATPALGRVPPRQCWSGSDWRLGCALAGRSLRSWRMV
jgi:type IV secretion system protein VirD4